MRYTDPPYSCDYLNFFIEKRIEPIINQKSKEYVVAFHPRNGFFQEPPLSREDLKGLADFIYKIIDQNKKWVYAKPIIGMDDKGNPIAIDSWNNKENN